MNTLYKSSARHLRAALPSRIIYSLQCLVCTVWLWSAAPYAATQVEIDNMREQALAYLFVHQDADGFWNVAGKADIQTTAMVLHGFYDNGLTQGIHVNTALSWLSNTQAYSTNALGQQTGALGLFGWDVTDALDQLSANINGRHAAWGSYAGYQPSMPDTAIAHDAWFLAGVTSPTASSTTAYLRDDTTTQNTDGGWPYMSKTLVGAVSGSSRVIPTAYSVITLSRYKSLGIGSQTDITQGINWLLGQQLGDGGFADDLTVITSNAFETALVLYAIKTAQAASNGTANAATTPIDDGLDYLINSQALTGAWNDDLMATATVLNALANVNLLDGDKDGIPDGVELLTFTDPLVADAGLLITGIGDAIAGLTTAEAILVEAQAGETFSFFLPFSGGTPVSFFAGGGLPAGLILNALTGELSGTPESGGDYPFSYTVSFADGEPQELVVTLSVDGPVKVNVPLPIRSIIVLALLLLPISLWSRAKQTVVSVAFVGLLMSLLTASLLAISPNTLAESKLPANTAKQITDAFIDHPAKRNETVRSISGHVDNLSRSLEEYHSEDARKMFAKAHRTAIDALNKRLNEELAGKRNRFNDNASSTIQLNKTQIAKKDASLQALFNEIDALQSFDGGKVLDAFLSLRKRLNKAKGIRYPNHPVPTWTHTSSAGEPLSIPASKKIPAYLSDTYRERAQNMIAFNGDMLLAAAPATAVEAQSCGYTAADLADDGQDITIEPKIQALAKKLKYSTINIFEYVANEIEFQPYYGAIKGAHATLMTGSGSATDQSSLLIALLRASNIPARYVRGDIEANIGNTPEIDARVTRWLQVKTLNAAALRLSENGNPAASSLPNDYLRFSHVWVEVCVPYAHYQGSGFDQRGHRWIPLDPSFEIRRYQEDISANVEFDFDNYLSSFQARLPEERYLSQINSTITEPEKSVSDVGYQSVKEKIFIDVIPASLPYNVYQFTSWENTGSPEAATLPDSHRYFLTIEAQSNIGVSLGVQHTIPLREAVLNRVTLFYQGQTTAIENTVQNWRLNGGDLATGLDMLPVIKVDGVVKALGTVAVKSEAIDNIINMRVTQNEHRFSRVNKLNCPSVSGTQLVNDACFDTVSTANYHSLQAWGHQESDALLNSLATKIIEHVNANPVLGTDIDNTLGRFLHYVSLRFLTDVVKADKAVRQVVNRTGDNGINLGLVGSQSTVSKVLDLPFGMTKSGFYIDMPGGQSLSESRGDEPFDFDSFLLRGFAASAHESEIWQKTARLDAVSTVRGIQYAKENGNTILKINSANQGVELSKLIAVENQNSGSAAYPNGFINSFLKPEFLNQGFEITLPDRRINYEGWQGEVIMGEKDTPSVANTSFFISGGFAGGYSVRNPINFIFDPFYNTGYRGSVNFSLFNGSVSGGTTSSFDLKPAIFQSDYGAIGNGGGFFNTFAGDPVNLVTGNFYHTERDISIPHRDLPFVFERVYNSREPQDGALGFGWTHSFNHKLVFLDELTDEQETAADTNGTTQSLVWIDGTGGEKRIEVSGASASGVTGSSTFTNREGQYFNFVRETNGSFTITEKNGLVYRFEASAGDVDDEAKLTQIQSRNGNTLTLTYNGNELDKVTDSTGRFINFTYTANRISRVEDWTGRAHEYTYSTEGDLISYKNSLALAGEQEPVLYDYFTAADAPTIDHAIKSITLPKGNGMSFEYYVDGRVFRHTNTAGETFSFQYNDFRRETIVTDSRGYTKQYFFNEYGNPVEIINEEGGISTYEYTDPSDNYLRTAVVNEARLRTEYEYNSNGTLVLQRNPSGSTVEYSNFNAFEQPGKIKDANGNYSLLKYDAEGNVTDKIALKAGVGSGFNPSSYVPAQANLLSWITSSYDTAGNLTSATQVRDVTTAEGFSQQWQFDANQLYATQIQRCGDKNGDGAINTATDDPCDTAFLQHDALGRLEQGINNRFEKTEYRYDDLDRLIRGTDALGNIRDYGFDANGNTHEQSLSMSKFGHTYYNRKIDTNEEVSEALTRVDSSSSRFDDSDRLRVSLDAAGNATYFSYDPMGNVKTVTNPDNYTIAFEYDGLGRVTSAFDEEGREARRDLDPIGRMRSLTDPNGNAETFNYYSAANDGRLEKRCEAPASSQSVAHCTTFNYDNNGNVTAIIDNAGNLTQSNYDALNRPVRIVESIYTDPVHGQVRPVTRYTYDLLGNSTQIDAGYTDVLALAANDVLSTQQTNVLDDWGRVLTRTDALGEIWSYTYNVSGDVLTETMPFLTLTGALGSDDLTPKTVTRAYVYGGLMSKEGGVSYKHNPLGQVTEVKGRLKLIGSGYYNNYTYSYDSAHRLESEAGGGLNKTYTLSAGGLLERVDLTRGSITDTIAYRYDKTGRLQSIGYNDEDFVGYTFDDAGRLKQKIHPGNVSTTYNYFDDDRLKQLLVKGPTANTLLQQDFGYDNVGRRDALTENLNGATTSSSYAYDNLSRLTQETLGANTQSFTYDSFGNRVTHNKFDSSVDYYEHDAAHQLKIVRENNASGAIKARHQYAPNGDLIRVCEGASAPNVTTDELIRGECDLNDYTGHIYNEYGKLIQTSTYEVPVGATHQFFVSPSVEPDFEQSNTEYAYDYAGRRMQVSGFTRSGVGQDVNSNYIWLDINKDPHNTQYRYNGEAIYLSYKTGNSITNPNARWLQGAGVDEPLVRYGNDGSITNYHQNGRNSAVLTTSVNSGAVVASQQFDAFGNVQASSGTINQYGYTGREPDASGLMYYRARYYSPKQGRFLQRDPKGMIDGINQYAYVRNNPVNRIDPNGTVSIGTNNFSSLNNNYFSSGGTTSQTLFNTNNNIDLGGVAQTTSSLGGDTSFLPTLVNRSENGLVNGLNSPSINTITAGVDAGGSVFGGVIGGSVSAGAAFDVGNGQSCFVSTGCFQVGVGVFGGVGISAGAGVSPEALSSGAAESIGIFGNVGAFGAAGGGSINIGDESLSGAKGFIGIGKGVSIGVQFCRASLKCGEE